MCLCVAACFCLPTTTYAMVMVDVAHRRSVSGDGTSYGRHICPELESTSINSFSPLSSPLVTSPSHTTHTVPAPSSAVCMSPAPTCRQPLTWYWGLKEADIELLFAKEVEVAAATGAVVQAALEPAAAAQARQAGAERLQ